jgi:hypothetical protein
MRKSTIIMLACLALSACKTIKEYVPVERIVRETVTVRDTVIDVQIKQIHDSVTVDLSRDTVSYLENTYAYSYALVSDGNLTHSLGTNKAPIQVETKYIERVLTDSIPYMVEMPVLGPEIIIHKPTFWQIVRYLAIGIVIAFAGLLVYKIFKR